MALSSLLLILYVVFMAAIVAIILWYRWKVIRRGKRRLARQHARNANYATCQRGHRLSEWFVYGDFMYCYRCWGYSLPVASPWRTHAEYRAATARPTLEA